MTGRGGTGEVIVDLGQDCSRNVPFFAPDESHHEAPGDAVGNLWVE